MILIKVSTRLIIAWFYEFMSTYNVSIDSIDEHQEEILQVFKDIFRDQSKSLSSAIKIHQKLKKDINLESEWAKDDSISNLFKRFLCNVKKLHRTSLPLIIPPMLRIMDDHNEKNRITGVECLKLFLQKMDYVIWKGQGLEHLFLESLYTCLSFKNSQLSIKSFYCILCILNLQYIRFSQESLIAFDKLLGFIMGELHFSDCDAMKIVIISLILLVLLGNASRNNKGPTSCNVSLFFTSSAHFNCSSYGEKYHCCS